MSEKVIIQLEVLIKNSKKVMAYVTRHYKRWNLVESPPELGEAVYQALVANSLDKYVEILNKDVQVLLFDESEGEFLKPSSDNYKLFIRNLNESITESPQTISRNSIQPLEV